MTKSRLKLQFYRPIITEAACKFQKKDLCGNILIPQLAKMKNCRPDKIVGLHLISRDSKDEGYGSHFGVHNKEHNYNSIFIVHQHGGYDVTRKPRII